MAACSSSTSYKTNQFDQQLQDPSVFSLCLFDNGKQKKKYKKIMQAVGRSAHLRCLTLNTRKLNYNRVKHLVRALHNNSSLTDLTLDAEEIEGKKMTQECFNLLMEGLRTRPVRTSLVFHRCYKTSLYETGKGFASIMPNLNALNFSGCELQKNDVEALGHELLTNSSLTSLSLSKGLARRTPGRFIMYYPRGNDSFQALSSAISFNTTLTSLDLSSDIVLTNVPMFLKQVGLNTSLTHLNLNNRSLSNESLNTLLHLLEHHPSLNNLNVRELNLSTEAVIELARIIKSHTRLETLSLRFLRFQVREEATFKIFTRALGENKSIKKLNLLGCDLLNDRANSMAEMIERTTTISKIFIDIPLMGSAGNERLCDAFKRNYSIEVLGIGWEGIPLRFQLLRRDFLFVMRNAHNHRKLSEGSLQKECIELIRANKIDHSFLPPSIRSKFITPSCLHISTGLDKHKKQYAGIKLCNKNRFITQQII